MWTNSDETEELLDQARQGDADAVERLLTVHREPLRRMIDLRLDPALAARVDASDIVQDVLLEAHRRLAGLPPQPGHAVPPLAAAHRQGPRHRRPPPPPPGPAPQPRPRAVDDPPARPTTSSLELAAQFLDRELTPASRRHPAASCSARSQAAIAELDEDDREIILMRHVEQLSNQEVAAALGLTRGGRVDALPAGRPPAAGAAACEPGEEDASMR